MKDVDTLQQYFTQSEMLHCREFAYYASREDVLTEKEIREYHNTLLHAVHLTVLEDGQLVKVLEDEEDEEVAPKVEEGYLKITNILRWNFPLWERSLSTCLQTL